MSKQFVSENEYDDQNSVIDNPNSEKITEKKEDIVKNPKDTIKDSTKKPNILSKIVGFFGRHKKFIILSLVFFVSLIILIGAGAVVWVMAQYNQLPPIESLVSASSKEGSVVYDRNGKEMYRYLDGGQKQELVGIDRIPENMQLATIALEDENFYNNPDGIPWQNMFGAATRCALSGGSTCRGGSGLSQQLIKNITGRDERTADRKLDELLIARKLNEDITKKDVLRLYLNWVYFGRNAYGLQAASKVYFGHDIDAKDKDGKFLLTVPKACYLASMVQRPSVFANGVNDILKNKESDSWKLLEVRKNACIDKMSTTELRGKGTGIVLTKSEAEILQKEKVDFKPIATEDIKYGHIRNYLTQELSSKLGIEEQDLATKTYDIYTTFDLDIQSQTEKAINDSYKSRIAANGGNNGAALVLDGPTGEIVAMVGSRDFNDDSIDGQVNITTSARQPGSSIKPYIYAAAFEKGFNPSTVLLDLSTNFGGYTPRNFDRQDHGNVSMRYALQNSFNISTVKAMVLLQDASNNPNTASALQNFFAFADKTGVKFPLKDKGNCGLTTALGACEVDMLSHTTGINTLLQEGNLRTATPFRQVFLKERNILTGKEISKTDVYAEQKKSRDIYQSKDGAIDPLIAREIANVMSDYGSRSSGIWGAGARNLELSGWNGANSVAAKTGTTSDVKDTWTVGGTPYYTVSVWVGNADGKPMNPKSSSSQVAAPIWKDVMTFLHKDKEKKGFSIKGLSKVAVDPATGLLDPQGTSTLMTQAQAQALEQASGKLSNSSYDPTKNSIFSNRTPIIQRKLKISLIDNKLLPEKSDIPEQFTKEIDCGAIISEFPLNDNWRIPAEKFGSNKDQPLVACPTETTDLTKDKVKLDIQANLKEGESIPEITTITATTPNPNGKIVSITMKVDGQTVAQTTKGGTLNFDLSQSTLILTGIKDVLITATDDNGLTGELLIPKIDFGQNISSSSSSSANSTDLNDADLSTLVVDCNSVTVGKKSSCTIQIPAGRTLPDSTKVFIGNNQIGGNCNASGVCNNVSTVNNVAGTLPIRISLSGDYASSIVCASVVVLN